MTFSTSAPPLGILLVEDDTVAAIELECLLEDIGHRVVATAVAPGMALRALSRNWLDVDMAIFGATLVGLPSFSLALEFARVQLPAIVTSTYPESFVRGLGFTQPFLRKPFRRSDVEFVLHGVDAQLTAPAA